MRYFLLIAFLFLYTTNTWTQPCTTPGQNPPTAFPVCGTSTFTQTTVPLCGGKDLPFKGCGNNSGLSDINPFWYKFTCFKSGTLGFLITPKDMGDDYDWELYDVTGKNPNDIYTDASLVISNNWSGEPGLTGASTRGNETFVCGGFGKPLYSKMPNLIEGHNYLLLISHFTRSQSGYSLSFGGGSAVITDAGIPALKSVEAHCSGTKLGVKISKNIKCNSSAGNGSDFYLMPGNIALSQATGFGCTAGFDTDSLELTASQPLAPGNYTLHIKKGTDNNTLLDYCDNAIPETDKLTFTILPRAPVKLDSLSKLNCAPKQVRLYFNKPVLCNSIATDGSDFTVQGNSSVDIAGVTVDCNGSTTKSVLVNFTNSIQQGGNYNLVLKKGADGNTILDECMDEAAAGGSLPFQLKDTVNASFTYSIQYGCSTDMVLYTHASGNGTNSWKWNLDDGQQSNQQNPSATYTLFKEKNIQLIVSNGFCSDTSSNKVVLDNYLKSDFIVLEDNCPNELIPFSGKGEGKIVGHLWEFGDGGQSTEKEPRHLYNVQRETAFPVKYTVTDQWGCTSTAQKTIKIYASCYLAVPTAFTPNSDGLNDRLQPLNAIKATDLVFTVYNRWGQKVFETKDWKKGWDGKVNGHLQPAAVYIWTLHFTDRDTNKKMEQKGTVALIR